MNRPKKDFYKAVMNSLPGFISCAGRLSDEATRLVAMDELVESEGSQEGILLCLYLVYVAFFFASFNFLN